MTLNVPIPQVPQRTNNNDIHEDEDSENDPDYVPKDNHNHGSESSDSEESNVDSGSSPRKKKQKLGAGPTPATRIAAETKASEEEERAQKEKARQQLWEEFQASLASPNASSTQRKLSLPKFVKIVKKYRFAGEDVIKVEEVPEGSSDAKKWPRWDPSMSIAESTSNETTPPNSSSTYAAQFVGNALTHGDGSTKAATPDKPARRITVKKTRKSLDAMFASATASVTASALSKFNSNADAAALSRLAEVKGQKLTTLGKSAMDWNEHLQSIDEGSRDEMEKNRKTGGSYLSKVEFLQRVEERVENVAEEGRSKRRRA